MNNKDKIREEIDLLAGICFGCGGIKNSQYDAKHADKCFNKISALIKEEMLRRVPKEKEKPKSETWLDWDEHDFLHCGYNEALADMRKAINEE